MIRRLFMLLAFAAVCAATSCERWTAIEVTPGADQDWITARDSAFFLAEHVASDFNLAPIRTPDLVRSGFTMCFAKEFAEDNGYLRLCGKTKDRAIHF